MLAASATWLDDSTLRFRIHGNETISCEPLSMKLEGRQLKRVGRNNSDLDLWINRVWQDRLLKIAQMKIVVDRILTDQDTVTVVLKYAQPEGNKQFYNLKFSDFLECKLLSENRPRAIPANQLSTLGPIPYRGNMELHHRIARARARAMR